MKMPTCFRGTFAMTFAGRFTFAGRVMNTRHAWSDAGRSDQTPTDGHFGKISCTRRLAAGPLPLPIIRQVTPNW